MKKNILTLLTVGFSLFFLVFVFDLTKDISQLKINLLKSPNVIDATNLIQTKIKITEKDLALHAEWSRPSWHDENWKKIQIPTHQILKEPEYKEGSYVYYRISVPKEAFEKLRHLKNETSLALYYVVFSQVDIVVNGKGVRTNKPKSAVESVVLVPLEEGKDNLIGIKGLIKKGNSGIDHRDPILLGRTAELNELYRASYKGMTVFPLIFLLSKGGILFIFSLIYLLLKVDRSFEKFLIFGLCTVVEELLAGDYLHGPLNYYQMVYLYNTVNIGAAISLFLFFSDLLNFRISSTKVKIISTLLIVVSFGLAIDSLYWNKVITIVNFMKFWNIVMVALMISFIPKMFRQDKLLFGVICISISLYVWSALFSSNVGLNMKAYGNLLLYFMVSYQTIALFRREQARLFLQERKLLEQEKDVAIGKTAKLLAHDVRRPLELMQILLDKISSGELSEDFLETAKKDVQFSLTNVSYQVSDIMNFSKVSKVKLRETSLYKVLAASIRQVMTINSNLDIQLQYQFNEKYKIFGDESRLAGALVNIITNAVEAIKDTGGKSSGIIRFITERSAEGLTLKIFNDGPPIPEDLLGEIFKPLFSNGKIKGTGLGLSSVLKVMHDHEGTIDVRNCPAGGVEFSLEFKRTNIEDDFYIQEFGSGSKAYGYINPSSKDINSKPKFRLFLLDDDAQTAQYFQFLIQQLPFDVNLTHASDYETGVEMIGKSRFDLYVLDYDLGGDKTGQDFYEKHLSFLSDEVIFHANRDLYDPKDLGRTFYAKPISIHDLTQVCERVYKNRLRILLIDDTKLIRIAWSSFHGSHNLTPVSSPEEAITLLEKSASDFDMCVVDYHFENSRLNGEIVVQKILELRNDMKIVVASSIEQQITGIRSISKRDYEVRRLQQ